MMRKIAVVTATRAEYGLLAPVIRELRKQETAEHRVELLVTGTHLSDQYGNTVEEIKKDGLRIDACIEISVDSKDALDIGRNQGEALVKFTEVFQKKEYDAVILLGDRYEMLAVAIAAGNTRTPIFHISGGDTTEGAVDEWIRHSITKMSYLHFTTSENSRKRVIQLGEHPDRVFCYGSTSIDNILQVATMTKEEALESVGLADCNYILCTYHPVTMEKGNEKNMVKEFLAAIQEFPDFTFLLTKSNADQGGAEINELFENAEKDIGNLHVFASLGVKRYLSLMRYAELVLGNSSSGIVEAPAFYVPTVDIGDRQRGRIQAKSVFHCSDKTEDIVATMKKALQADREVWRAAGENPYGDGHAAEKIAKKSWETVLNGRIDLKKKFYDIEK